MKAYERVVKARDGKRLSNLYFINKVITDFIEFHGDRRYAEDAAIVGGIGFLDGMPVTVIAMERGSDIQDRMRRNFGCPSPEGYRKALRLMKQAEKFNRPVICLVSGSGAYCGVGAEERGQGLAIAENLMEMMTLKTPVVTVVTGEGGSGGALALSVADNIFMLENAVYSVISPEGCASILWKDAAKASEAAEALKLTAADLHEFGVIEKIIYEENKTNDDLCDDIKTELVSVLKELKKVPTDKLLEDRYNKFRKIGAIQ